MTIILDSNQLETSNQQTKILALATAVLWKVGPVVYDKEVCQKLCMKACHKTQRIHSRLSWYVSHLGLKKAN